MHKTVNYIKHVCPLWATVGLWCHLIPRSGIDFNDVRQRFCQVPSLQDLFIPFMSSQVTLDFRSSQVSFRMIDCF